MENEILKKSKESTLVSDVRNIVEQGLQTAFQGVNSVLLHTYWLVGRRIVEEEQHGEKRAAYGKTLLKGLANQLVPIYGTSYSERNLYSMRQFFLMFNDIEILNSRVQNLTWTHFRKLLRVTDDDARYWYMREASREVWSVRTLDRNIASQYYYRLLQSPKKEAVIAEMHQLTAPLQEPREMIKSPVVAEFLGLPTNAAFTETELERAIIHHLKDFLLELGKGFAFVAEQQHIRTEQNDYYIDLVFYNYLLKSFVLIELLCCAQHNKSYVA